MSQTKADSDVSRHTLRYLAHVRVNLYEYVGAIILVDLILAFLTYYLSFEMRANVRFPYTLDYMPLTRLAQVQHRWFLLFASQVLIFFLLDLYHDIQIKELKEIGVRAAIACLLQGLLIVSVNFFFNTPYPRSIVLIYGVLNAGAVTSWRWIIQKCYQPESRTVFILDHVVSQGVQKSLQAFVGKVEVYDTLDQVIQRMAASPAVPTVLVVPAQAVRENILQILWALQVPLVRVYALPDEYEILMGRLHRTHLFGVPVIRLGKGLQDPIDHSLRRLRDVVCSVLVLLFFSPIWLFIALVIGLASKGPVFFRQTRVGQGGRPFHLYKFRTMFQDAEEDSGPTLATRSDPRITRVGKLLRRFRMDELPQLFNILKGDMSLVGPRPERVEFVQAWCRKIPYYNERHLVKPGITGPAQVYGFYETLPEIKLRYDLAYIFNYSFLMDIGIMFETLRVMLSRRGV